MSRFNNFGTYKKTNNYTIGSPRPMTRDSRGRLTTMTTAEEMYARTPSLSNRSANNGKFLGAFSSPERLRRERAEVERFYTGQDVGGQVGERLSRQRMLQLRINQHARGEWDPDYGEAQKKEQYLKYNYKPSGKMGPDYKESKDSRDTTKESISTKYNESKFLSRYGSKIADTKQDLFKVGSKSKTRVRRDMSTRTKR